jgi:hypothetical protein
MPPSASSLQPGETRRSLWSGEVGTSSKLPHRSGTGFFSFHRTVIGRSPARQRLAD